MEGIKNPRSTVGIGYLIIPKGVNYQDFERTCFNKEQFCIITNDGETLLNVPVSSQILNDLKLPKDADSLGSQIIYLNFYDHNKPIIIATFSKQAISEYRQSGDFILKKDIGGLIGVSGNSLLSKIKLFAKNVKSKIAKVSIEVSGSDKSEINLESSGWIICQFAKGFKAKNGQREFTINETAFSFTDGKRKLIIDDKFSFSDGTNKFQIDSEGYKLGNINFKSFMTSLLNMIGKEAIFSTPIGPTAPGCSSTTPSVNTLLSEIENINT